MKDEEIKYKLQKAFGWTDEQLLKEWDAAEQIIKEHPELKASDDEKNNEPEEE